MAPHARPQPPKIKKIKKLKKEFWGTSRRSKLPGALVLRYHLTLPSDAPVCDVRICCVMEKQRRRATAVEYEKSMALIFFSQLNLELYFHFH